MAPFACRISAAAQDVLFEHSERVRIGDHEGGHVLIDDPLQRADVQDALLARLDVLHRVSRDGRRGGVGAVRRIGNQDFAARVAALFEQRADQQNAGKFAVRARRRLQGHRVHAGDLGQRRFQARHHLHGSLRKRFRLVGVGPGEALDARHHLVDPRVVLHGAGTQRIHAVIDGVVPGGEAREVADGLHLAHLGKVLDFGAHVLGAERFGRVHRRHV